MQFTGRPGKDDKLRQVDGVTETAEAIAQEIEVSPRTGERGERERLRERNDDENGTIKR
ncbi:MAG: hypothetical protein J5I35_06275 [Methanothrix harundinacea]|nr:hypothetical protein [Methanothrix harundinacea]